MLITAWLMALPAVAVLAASAMGWGWILRKFLSSNEDRFPLILVSGLGLLLWASELVGTVGFNIWAHSALVAIGLVGAWRLWCAGKRREALAACLPRGKDWLWIVLPGLYFVSQFFSAGLPREHGDPLLYHLLSGRFWAEAGHIAIPESNPVLSHSGLWETLYGIVQLWVGTRGMLSHVAAQIAGQWLHLFLGQLVCVLVVQALLLEMAPMAKRGMAFFLAWVIVCLPSYEWSGGLAKNDFGVAAFAMCGYLAVVSRRWRLAGWFVGLAFAVKLYAAWAAIGVLLLSPVRVWTSMALLGFVGALPNVVRNLVSTGNPLFPMLDQLIGPHWISSDWWRANAVNGGGPKWDPAMFSWFWNEFFFGKLAKASLIIGLAMMVMQLVQRWRKRHGTSELKLAEISLGRWIFSAGTQLVFAFFLLRPTAGNQRYINFVTILVHLILVSIILREAWRLVPLRRWGWIPVALCGFAISIPVHEIIKGPVRFLDRDAATYPRLFHHAQLGIDWINDNVMPSDKVMFLWELKTFYLDVPYEAIMPSLIWERRFSEVHDTKTFFNLARSYGFRYVYLSTYGAPPSGLAPILPQLWARTDLYAYSGSFGAILDLQRLNGSKGI